MQSTGHSSTHARSFTFDAEGPVNGIVDADDGRYCELHEEDGWLDDHDGKRDIAGSFEWLGVKSEDGEVKWAGVGIDDKALEFDVGIIAIEDGQT